MSIFCLMSFIIQEFQELKDQLHEKVKENKRIKENFDTLKMANDTLNKEVCKINVTSCIITDFEALCCITSEISVNLLVKCSKSSNLVVSFVARQNICCLKCIYLSFRTECPVAFVHFWHIFTTLLKLTKRVLCSFCSHLLSSD